MGHRKTVNGPKSATKNLLYLIEFFFLDFFCNDLDGNI